MVAKDFAVKGLSMSNATIAPTLQLSSARKAREFVAQYDQGRDGAVTLFLVGIRDLKHINERYGRETGDVVIRKTGARLLTYFRESLATVPVLARLPGREFLIAVAGEHSATELEAAARRLVSLLSDELGGMSAPLHISPRVGIAIAGEAESGADLLQRAHEALAQAYSRKGRKYAFAEPAIRGSSQQAALLDKGLRSAIASGEIIILLQPQFEVATGRLSGAEALARWHHPEIGEVGAGRVVCIGRSLRFARGIVGADPAGGSIHCRALDGRTCRFATCGQSGCGRVGRRLCRPHGRDIAGFRICSRAIDARIDRRKPGTRY